MADAGPFARKLACDLILDQFGEIVQKVCECLISRGQLQLAEIAQITGIELQPLRNCLLVLIQHNCVQAFQSEQEGAFGASPKRSTFYIAIVDNILHRMRFPKFLTLVQQEHGKEAENLVSCLLQHGRLTLDQLLQRAAEQKSESEVDITMREAFTTLVRAHFVERAPAAEPVLRNNKEQPPRKKVKTATRVVEIVETPEQRVISAAALVEAERFRVPASLEELSNERDSEIEPQRKRKRPEELENTRGIIDDKEVLWRVNNEEFLRHLRHQTCVKFVRSKTDTGTGTVVSCMMKSRRHSETMVREPISEALDMNAIRETLNGAPEGRAMTMERVQLALEQLMDDGFVDRTGDGAAQYVVNMHGIIDLARQNEIEGIVLQKYGQKCARIFKILMKGFSDHKKISDKSMLPVKETWELLYKLDRAKYIERQEVPTTADGAPGKAIFLWRVNPAKVARNVLNDMYHAAWNLGRRLAHELEQEQELLSLSKRGSVVLTATQQDQATRLSNVAKVLETSLLRLDDALLLFHDF